MARLSTGSQRSGGGILQTVRTMLWVVPLTLLLWIYAEREQLAETRDVPATVELRCAAPDRVVGIITPEDRRVYLDLEGPRSSIEAVRDALFDRRTGPLELTVPEDLPATFEGDISAAERLGRNDLFRERAVTVLRCRPTVRIKAERKQTEMVPVRLRPEEKFVGVVVFEPDTVPLGGPESLFRNTPPERLAVYADMSRFAGQKPGHYEGEVPLLFTFAVPAPFSARDVTFPRTVKVKVETQRSQEDVLPSIPLLVQVPARILESDRFRVQAPVTLPNVSVTGPPEVIQALKAGKLPAAAVLELTPEDFVPGVDKAEKTRKLRPEDYRMPKDVTVTNPEREVSFVVSDRSG